MSRKLIVSADDYGLSSGYDLGAVRAFREGVATVLALIVNTSESPRAVELRNEQCPEAPLSLHLNLCMGRPVSKPEEIPSLVDERGMLCRSPMWSAEASGDAKCQGKLNPSYDDILAETRAQIDRFVELTGESPNRIESHSVVTQNVMRALAQVGEELGIHTEAIKGGGTASMRSCGECMPRGGNEERRKLIARGCTPEDWECDAFGIQSCPYEIAILHFHPGYVDQGVVDRSTLVLARCRDLETLTDARVRSWIDRNGISLVDYSEIYISAA